MNDKTYEALEKIIDNASVTFDGVRVTVVPEELIRNMLEVCDAAGDLSLTLQTYQEPKYWDFDRKCLDLELARLDLWTKQRQGK